MSPASASFRSNPPPAPHNGMDDPDPEPEPLPPADVTEPGELPITPALTTAFLASLRSYGVHLKFFSGESILNPLFPKSSDARTRVYACMPRCSTRRTRA